MVQEESSLEPCLGRLQEMVLAFCDHWIRTWETSVTSLLFCPVSRTTLLPANCLHGTGTIQRRDPSLFDPDASQTHLNPLQLL